MAAPATIPDFLALVRKSELIEEGRLAAYVEPILASPQPPEPRKLAGFLIRDGYLTYFQAEQFLLGKWRGFHIGKYKLLERIGFGGMGQVFLCEHTYMRRRVAIKVLPPAKADDPAAHGRFYREARAAGMLDHPNIVRTHDIDQDGNLHFLVMEYVDGASLLDIVRKHGKLSALRATHYIQQAAEGLEYAYRSGIVHRDIKPGNIMIDRGGTAKVLDMGLARFYHDDEDMLTLKYDEKSVLGTADYVAPEQVLNSHSVDIRADIYGLGATFYFLLAGHPIFPDGSVAQKLMHHQTRRPRPIRELRPDVPEGLALVIERMVEKDPRARYATPADVAEALAPWAADPIDPPPEHEMPRLSPAAYETTPGTHVPRNDPSRDSSVVRPEVVFQRPIKAVPQFAVPEFSSRSAPAGAALAAVAAPPSAASPETGKLTGAYEHTPQSSPRFTPNPFAVAVAAGVATAPVRTGDRSFLIKVLASVAAASLIGTGLAIGLWRWFG